MSSQFYTVDKYDIRESLELKQDQPFLIISVIDGAGTIDGEPVQKGENLILPYGYGTAQIEGSMCLITAHI